MRRLHVRQKLTYQETFQILLFFSSGRNAQATKLMALPLTNNVNVITDKCRKIDYLPSASAAILGEVQVCQSGTKI
jgi:hypothetical protein